MRSAKQIFAKLFELNLTNPVHLGLLIYNLAQIQSHLGIIKSHSGQIQLHV